MNDSLNKSAGDDSSIPKSSIDPYSDEFLKDPYPFFEEIRALGPLVKLVKYDCLVTVDHAVVSQTLKDPAVFCSSAGVGLSNFHKEEPWRPPSLVLETDPPEHSRTRMVLNKALSPAVLRSLRTYFEAEAEKIVEEVVKQKQFDVVPELAEAYPLKVLPDAVGLPAEGRENLLPYGSMVFNALGPRNHLFAEAFKNAQPVQDWILKHCKKENLSTNGFGAKIHEAATDGDITEEEASLLVRSLLSAGVDTTVNAIGSAIYCFTRFPEQWDLLREDLSLARSAFEEVIRFEGVAHSFYRTTTKAVKVAGLKIEAGQKILVLLAGANRDPAKWPEPDKFLITRDCRGHAGFGMGVHTCVGMKVARMEGELILRALARRVKRFELAGEPIHRLNNSLRGLASLPVTIS